MEQSRDLNKDEIEWFLDRLYESKSGRIQVATNVINKYKKLTNRPDLPNWQVRFELMEINTLKH